MIAKYLEIKLLSRDWLEYRYLFVIDDIRLQANTNRWLIGIVIRELLDNAFTYLYLYYYPPDKDIEEPLLKVSSDKNNGRRLQIANQLRHDSVEAKKIEIERSNITKYVPPTSGGHGLGIGICKDITDKLGIKYTREVKDGCYVASLEFEDL
jgi:nitrogen fixation protein